MHDGILGANDVVPLDVMAFFIALAYIAISIDASGLIRYLALKVLQRGGESGRRLFFYLYAFFFGLSTFIGNDPVILSGTAFLAYMTRVSRNIMHRRAWTHTQFAVANIASAVLVSSNPTNLVVAGAFAIKFVDYTANMIVPVVITAVLLFPFLLYIIFADESLIPISIEMHELPPEARARKPMNPNIPHARGKAEELENNAARIDEQGALLSLEEIMNPFLDKSGAAFGAFIMVATLVTLLTLNGVSSSNGEHPVFQVTLPAAFVMFCWDVAYGWLNRKETREIARKGRREVEAARAERAMQEERARQLVAAGRGTGADPAAAVGTAPLVDDGEHQQTGQSDIWADSTALSRRNSEERERGLDDLERRGPSDPGAHQVKERQTLVSASQALYRWCQETFPTSTAVLGHLPYCARAFRPIHVYPRPGAGHQRLGPRLCLRVGPLGRQDGHSWQYRRHGVPVSHLVQCESATMSPPVTIRSQPRADNSPFGSCLPDSGRGFQHRALAFSCLE